MKTRRDFLKSLGKYAGATLVSCSVLGKLEALTNEQRENVPGKADRAKPENVANILTEMGFKPGVYQYGGNKTLILATEIHLGLGRFYVNFLKSLRQKLDVSGAYLEGVLSENAEPDSYLASLIISGADKEEIEACRKRDASGYYGIRNLGIPVRGLEEPNLWRDKKQMNKIVELVYSAGLERKDERTLDELDKQIKALKVVKFPFELSDFKIFDRAEMARKVLKLDNHVALKMRNQSWAKIMQESMLPDSVYFSVVGYDHFYTPEILADFERGHGTLQDEFKEKKINAVAIEGLEVINLFAPEKPKSKI